MPSSLLCAFPRADELMCLTRLPRVLAFDRRLLAPARHAASSFFIFSEGGGMAVEPQRAIGSLVEPLQLRERSPFGRRRSAAVRTPQKPHPAVPPGRPATGRWPLQRTCSPV